MKVDIYGIVVLPITGSIMEVVIKIKIYVTNI